MHLEADHRVYTLVACVTCKRGVRPSEASTRMECMACLEARADRAEGLLKELVNRECQGFFDSNMNLVGCSRCWPRPSGRPTDPCTYETDCPIARARAHLQETP